MKRVLFFALTFCLIVACNMPGGPNAQSVVTAESQNTPATALESENTPLPAEIDAPIVESPSIVSLDMLDENNGWGLTETQVLRTNDGGVTWYEVTPPGLVAAGYTVSTDFLDVTHAWIQLPDPNHFPDGGTLYRTSDGGVSWTSNQAPFSDGNMAFLDLDNGWMMADLGVGAGSNAISVFQSTDGGVTWTRTYTNDPNLEGAGDTLPLGGLKHQITPLNMQTAWISGVVYAPGTVYLFRTDDGGHTWLKIDLALPSAAETGDLSVNQVEFLSQTRAVLALGVGNDTMQTLIYSTNDAGRTWALAPGALPDPGTLEILSTQEMVFYNHDEFYVTRDAASTWSSVKPDVAFGDNFAGMSFAATTTGWVVTGDTDGHHSLYKTGDGGATWFPIIP